jgi:Lon protease-like protein
MDYQLATINSLETLHRTAQELDRTLCRQVGELLCLSYEASELWELEELNDRAEIIAYKLRMLEAGRPW